MSIYRLKRRNFMLGLGGLLGFRMMLKNVEAAALGTPSPPRLVLVLWPGGTVPYDYLPTGSGTTYTTSPILQPFEAAGLRDDMIALFGTQTSGLRKQGGGSAEAGVPLVTTAFDSLATRQNGGESDDGIASAPSFDQIFLRHVPGLRRPGLGFVNMICDARVDSNETSSRCLSYSYDTREIDSAVPGGLVTEHVPLLPDLSPFDTYAKLFADFAPDDSPDEMVGQLALKKSVLDSSLFELRRMRELVPAAERSKLDLHEGAIRRVEQQLTNALTGGSLCVVPGAPDETLVAPFGNAAYSYGATGEAESADDTRIAQMGRLYFSLIRAAFQCDILRVATFQWMPTTNHAGFQGLYPADPDGAYMQHPLGSALQNYGSGVFGERQEAGTVPGDIVAFLTNVNIWFNQHLAEELALFKTAEDPFGGNLLDFTVIPHMTEKGHMLDTHTQMPSQLLGGRGLGLQGGQFMAFDPQRHHADLWLTVAQALLGIEDPLAVLGDETFVKDGMSPITGAWAPPA